MNTLYPPIEPQHSFFLDVGDGHQLYVEECGNPQGIPAVFLHGGPGAGCEPWQRRFFNPDIYRIVLFDQRGAGRSRPHAELDNNTLPHCIGDIERLRQHLHIKRWLVFGGSWGSTLGIAYAETYPSHCLALVLRGVFLCRQKDIDWFYQDGASKIFPDYWSDFEQLIPPPERHNMVAAYHRRLTSDNHSVRLQAAQAWAAWEGRALSLRCNQRTVDFFCAPQTALSLARIECHYFVNRTFMADGDLLARAAQLKSVPGFIVHGRYDMVCPVEQAWALKACWPSAQLKIVEAAGHAASEAGIVDQLVTITNNLAEQL